MTTYVLAPTIRFGLAGTEDYTVNFYDSLGLVAATTWSDEGTTPNSATMTFAANGTAGGGSGGGIYIQAGKSYRAIYKNAAGATVFDVDPILVADPSGDIGTAGTDLTLSGDLSVGDDATVSGDLTVSGAGAITGNLTVTGEVLGSGIKLTSLSPGFRNGIIESVINANAIDITYETPASATPSTTDPVSEIGRAHV